MTYSVKEIYKTIQGEGGQSGRSAVLCRFTGCNLWSGRQKDRASAICQFCDTDFVGTNGLGGGHFADPRALATEISHTWGISMKYRLVVFTGGEPLMQINKILLQCVRDKGFEIAIETNGTYKVPDDVDWICVSPKAGSKLVQTNGQELKLVFPQNGAMPKMFEHLNFKQFYLQPMAGPYLKRNIELAVAYCMRNPLWRISLQIHKIIGIS
ncbi:MAG: 7-carboxy-7-deazaguanine synthase [Hyphomicrobiaceae bacterium]|nr:7-carboxy-7-deazaguanine synthase [Hyphomicrobiaceae bacterium]